MMVSNDGLFGIITIARAGVLIAGLAWQVAACSSGLPYRFRRDRPR